MKIKECKFSVLLKMMAILTVLISPTFASAQYSWDDIWYCINAGEYLSPAIPYINANPISKSGWNLIFDEEFNCSSISPMRWDKSTWNDDGGNQCGGRTREFVMDPINVNAGCNLEGGQDQAIPPPIMANGYAIITNKINNNPDYPQCAYSMGEMKSFSQYTGGNPPPNDQFKSYYFYQGDYVEARVKILNKHGQGSAMWLYAPQPRPGDYSEIDVFETNGEDNNYFTFTYWWKYNGELHMRQECITLSDLNASNYDLTNNYTIFGVHWTNDAIELYVNNMFIKSLDLNVVPAWCCHTDGNYPKPIYPMGLRFWTGPNFIGDAGHSPYTWDMPQQMDIDYVRGYRPVGSFASPIEDLNNCYDICASENSFASSNTLLRAKYYPDVNYQWASQAFQFQYIPYSSPTPPEQVKLIVTPNNPNCPPNKSYPLYLQSTFIKSNYVENSSTNIYICGGAPPEPTGNYSVSRVGTTCYSEIKVPGDASHIRECQYWDDYENMWQPGTIKNNQCVFGLYLGEVDVQFQFKEKNACGWSPIHSGSATIPHYSGCVVDNPTGTGDSNVETKIKVSISPNPVNDKLNIKLLNFDILKSPSDLKIFDIYGNVVLQKSLTDVVNIINVDQLKCSIYLIMIIYNNDVIYKSKLIKQ